MKVFISWSGERSRQVAELLSTWIQCVLQAVEPWQSSKDIDRGSLWFSEITNQLSNTHNGIVCLTKSNLDKPWILFEAGALAKGLTSSRIYTFLIDLKPNDVKDPLAQFNHTTASKDDVFKLIRSINNGLESQALKANILTNVFDTYWPQFETQFENILKNTKSEDVIVERPKDDIMNEILYAVRGMDKRLQTLEDNDLGSMQRARSYFGNQQAKPSFLKTPIEDIDLSVRTFNQLKVLGIETFEDILMIDPKQMAMLPEKAIEELRYIIDKYGYGRKG